MFLCLVFTPEVELHNVASPTWFASTVSLSTKHSSNYIKGYKMSIISFPRPKKNKLKISQAPAQDRHLVVLM